MVKIKILSKITGLIAFFVVITTIIVNVRLPYVNLTVNNDWIGFLGNVFGGLLGAGVAILVFRLSVENEENRRKSELVKFKKYLVGTHLSNLQKILSQLNMYIKQELKKSSAQDGQFISFPHLEFPEMNYLEKVTNLREDNLVSYDFETTYFEIQLALQSLKESRNQNVIERNMYLKAHMDYLISKSNLEFEENDAFQNYMKEITILSRENFEYMVDYIDKNIGKIESLIERK